MWLYGGVDLARLVQVHHRRRVFHRIERDRLEPDVGRIPVLRIADVDERSYGRQVFSVKAPLVTMCSGCVQAWP